MDKFLEALVPVHNWVFYEGYGPYWVKHCRSYDGTGNTGDVLTAWNDIIEMGWDAEHGIWQKEMCWTLMMPPTMELIGKEYEEAKKNAGAL